MNFNVRQKKVINATEPNIVCLAGAGCGKCIPNSTNIPTPDGWRKVEEIKRTDEDISATKIITNIDNEKYFKENTPKEIHSLYRELVKAYSQ